MYTKLIYFYIKQTKSNPLLSHSFFFLSFHFKPILTFCNHILVTVTKKKERKKWGSRKLLFKVSCFGSILQFLHIHTRNSATYEHIHTYIYNTLIKHPVRMISYTLSNWHQHQDNVRTRRGWPLQQTKKKKNATPTYKTFIFLRTCNVWS